MFRRFLIVSILFQILNLSYASNRGRCSDHPIEIAPEWVVENWLNPPLTENSDFQSFKGCALVIEFWATWCKPCVKAIPHMNKMAESFKGKPIRFIAITDESERKVRNFLMRTPMSAAVGLDYDRSVFRDFNVTYIPLTVLIDKNGRIAAKTQPDRLTSDIIEKLLDDQIEELKLLIPKSEYLKNDSDVLTIASNPDYQFAAIFRISDNKKGPFIGKKNSIYMASASFPQLFMFAYKIDMQKIYIDPGYPTDYYEVLVKIPDWSTEDIFSVFQSMLKASFDYKCNFEKRKIDSCVFHDDTDLKPKMNVFTCKNETIGVEKKDYVICPLNKLFPPPESLIGKPVIFETAIHYVEIPQTGLQPPVNYKGGAAQWLADQLGLRLSYEKHVNDVLVLKKNSEK